MTSIDIRLAERFRTFSPHGIALLLKVSGALLFLGLFFSLAAHFQSLQAWDDSVLRFVGDHLRSPSWDFLMVDISSLGSLAVVVMLCLVSIVLFILTRDPAAAIHLVIVAVGGFKIAGWAKAFVDRPRPEIIPKLIQVGGKSFPSGHAVTASAIYLTLAILASRRFKSVGARATLFGTALVLIGAVGFSRIYLGVHHPSDVISGLLLGAAWALLTGALFLKRHFF